MKYDIRKYLLIFWLIYLYCHRIIFQNFSKYIRRIKCFVTQLSYTRPYELSRARWKFTVYRPIRITLFHANTFNLPEKIKKGGEKKIRSSPPRIFILSLSFSSSMGKVGHKSINLWQLCRESLNNWGKHST